MASPDVANPDDSSATSSGSSSNDGTADDTSFHSQPETLEAAGALRAENTADATSLKLETTEPSTKVDTADVTSTEIEASEPATGEDQDIVLAAKSHDYKLNREEDNFQHPVEDTLPHFYRSEMVVSTIRDH